jgi:hypothetical protein
VPAATNLAHQCTRGCLNAIENPSFGLESLNLSPPAVDVYIPAHDASYAMSRHPSDRQPVWAAGLECIYCTAIATRKRSSGVIRWS